LAKTATTEAVKVPIDMGIKNSMDKNQAKDDKKQADKEKQATQKKQAAKSAQKIKAAIKNGQAHHPFPSNPSKSHPLQHLNPSHSKSGQGHQMGHQLGH